MFSSLQYYKSSLQEQFQSSKIYRGKREMEFNAKNNDIIKGKK